MEFSTIFTTISNYITLPCLAIHPKKIIVSSPLIFYDNFYNFLWILVNLLIYILKVKIHEALALNQKYKPRQQKPKIGPTLPGLS